MQDDRYRGAAVRARQPRSRGGRRVRAAAAALRARLRTAISPPAISNSPGRRSAKGSLRWSRAAPRRIYAVPGMLFAASHVKNDLPWEMNSFIAAHPGIDVRLGRDLAIDAKLLAAAADAHRRRGAGRTRRHAAASSSGAAPTTPTPIRTSPSSRGCCGRGWGSAGPRRRSAASPIRASTLRSTALRGWASAASSCFPISCSPASWSSASTPQTDAVGGALPGDRIRQGGLSARPPAACSTPLSTASPRSATGDPAMNCQLCKYRAQIVGYEAEVGAPQQGHHHHVRGAGVEHHHHDPRPPTIIITDHG